MKRLMDSVVDDDERVQTIQLTTVVNRANVVRRHGNEERTTKVCS